MTKILYIDMDGVLVDLDLEMFQEYTDRLAEIPGIFSLTEPMPDAIDSFRILVDRFDTYIISTSPLENPAAVSDRFQWVKKYLGEPMCQRLILTNYKNLNIGDYLIDGMPENTILGGTSSMDNRFIGEHIHFGSEKFPDWQSVLKYLLN